MTDTIRIILFGSIGALLGILLPGIIESLIQARQSGNSQSKLTGGAVGAAIYTKLISGILVAGLWMYTGFRFDGFMVASLAALLITAALAITVIDWRIRRIPNELVLLMLIAGAAFQIIHFGIGSLPKAILSMGVMMAVFLVPVFLGGFDKIGAGDVKLAGAMGLVLGQSYIVPAVLVMCGALLVYCVIGLFFRKLTLASRFAFAPFMMLGMGFAMVCL